MNKNEWLEQCQKNGSILTEIVGNFYPYRESKPKSIGPITAQSAQNACDAVCAMIVEKEDSNLPPYQRFEVALKMGNVETLSSMLSSTWFGVPESTSCWEIPGFKELVNLLDDPPEYDEV